ncbi:MAG: hypothetical protein FJX78_06910 [Armatimonadetes bacterium]|nr:hypothetical protein [Armatimonadota bacterium]
MGLRLYALLFVAFVLFVGGAWAMTTPQAAVIQFAQELRDGRDDDALARVDVPAVASSTAEVLQREWSKAKAGDPTSNLLSEVMRPLFAQLFGLARPVIEQRLRDEIRVVVRQIADGDPKAPLQIPREGGWPAAVVAVLWGAEFTTEPDGRVSVVVRQKEKTVIHLRLARQSDQWRIVEADARWLSSVLRDRLVPGAVPDFPKPEQPRN